MRKLLNFVASALLLLSVQASAQTPAPVDLSDQVARSFTLPAGAFSNGFTFTVPSGVTRLKLDLVGDARAGDIDLFLRKDQNFIVTNSFQQNASFDDLAEYAHFASIGGTATESILITPSSNRPVTASRYYVAVINGANTPSTATIRLTLNPAVAATNFQVRFDLPCETGERNCTCDASAWNDPNRTGFAAPGNPGQTLGEKRRNAMTAAANLLASQINTEQPVVIRACFGDLGTGDTTVTLAQAGPSSFVVNDPSLLFRSDDGILRASFPSKSLTQNNTWMAIAPAARNAGTSGCRVQGGECSNHFDLSITFNSAVDTSVALGQRSYYYGTTGTPIAGDVDFVSVAVHEMTHGLGYLDLVSDDSGAKLRGRDDAYSKLLVLGTARPVIKLSSMTDTERLAAITSQNVQWIGAETLASPNTRLVFPDDVGPRVHAPNPAQQGSSIGHLEGNFYFNELMAPRYSSTRQLGIAGDQLKDIGWSNLARPAQQSAKIFPGNWFDPVRSGHGFDIEPAGKNGGFDRALVTTYSYDESGLPEWFLSVGQLVDGVFLADASNAASFSSLGRYQYRNGGAVIDQSFAGRLRIDFNQAETSAACANDGRIAAAGVGSLSLVANDKDVNWCIQPLIGQTQRPAQDFTGHWYSPSDSGWGVGIATAQAADKVVLLAVLYYPDATGAPRWAYAQSNDFRSGQSIEIFQRNAYCRTCAPVAPNDISAGRMTINLANVEGLAGQPNNITFNVDFKGPAGGAFARTSSPLIRLVERPREIQ